MVNRKNLHRGSVWLVDYDPTRGHEQAKCRPCLVVSADTYNQNLAGLVVVLPITSQSRDLYWYVPITPPEAGLDKESYVICDQIRSLSVQRFLPKMLGMVSDYTMDHIDERLKILLYLTQ